MTATNKIRTGQIAEEAWTSYVPTWTNLTKGDATIVAKYIKIGKTLHGYVALTWGSTTSASGDVDFSTPLTIATIPVNSAVGNATMRDNSTTSKLNGVVVWRSTTSLAIFVNNSVTAVGAFRQDVPWTWAVGDTISCSFTVEAA